MIVGSLLFILVAVILLVLGLAGGSSVLLISSVATSLLAAVALVAGARQAAGARSSATEDAAEVRPGATGRRFRRSASAGPAQRPGPAGSPDGSWTTGAGPVIPVQPSYGSPGTDDGRVDSGGGPASRPYPPTGTAAGPADGHPAGNPPAGDLPPDEPAAQDVAATDADRVAQLSDEVLVVDGRPRYHLPGCPHLSGLAGEPLPVREAIELGFTPCAGCEPVTALLADPRRV